MHQTREPVVSVVVATHNRQRSLSALLDSLRRQSLLIQLSEHELLGSVFVAYDHRWVPFSGRWGGVRAMRLARGGSPARRVRRRRAAGGRQQPQGDQRRRGERS